MFKKFIIYVLRYVVMEEYIVVGLNLSVVEGFMCINFFLMLCVVEDSFIYLLVIIFVVEKGIKN